MRLISTLVLSLFSLTSFAGTKVVCVSWMDLKTEIREVSLSEYETATIEFTQGDWAYVADVFEGKFNYITMTYGPLKVSTTARSVDYPLNHLSNAMEVDSKQATVDCDIR